MSFPIRLMVMNLSSNLGNSKESVLLNVCADQCVESVTAEALQHCLPSITTQSEVKAELHYFGRILKSNHRLEDYQIPSHAILYFIIKNAPPSVENPDPTAADRAIQGLQELAHKRQLEPLSLLLQNGNVARDVLFRNPQFVQGKIGILRCLLLRSPMLLVTLLRDPSSLKRTLKEHPALAEATLQLIKWHRETNMAIPVTPTSISVGTQHDFSVYQDQLEPAEEASSDDEDDPNSRERRARRVQANNARNWTPASGGRFARRPGHRQHRAVGSSGSATSISSDVFRSALNAALDTLNTSAGSTPGGSANTSLISTPRVVSSAASAPTPRQLYSQQLVALREMGVTDEDVALQMLIATKGNLEAAINLMFN